MKQAGRSLRSRQLAKSLALLGAVLAIAVPVSTAAARASGSHGERVWLLGRRRVVPKSCNVYRGRFENTGAATINTVLLEMRLKNRRVKYKNPPAKMHAGWAQWSFDHVPPNGVRQVKVSLCFKPRLTNQTWRVSLRSRPMCTSTVRAST